MVALRKINVSPYKNGCTAEVQSQLLSPIDGTKQKGFQHEQEYLQQNRALIKRSCSRRTTVLNIVAITIFSQKFECVYKCVTIVLLTEIIYLLFELWSCCNIADHRQHSLFARVSF